MKRNIVLTVMIAVILVTAGYIVPAVSMSIAQAATQPNSANPVQSVAAAPKLTALSDLDTAFETVYNQVNPSVVTIEVSQQAAARSGNPNVPGLAPFGQQQQAQRALGSGFVWDTQGHIVTNNHVVDGASQILVTFSDGNMVTGKVVGADSQSDLAVVQVNVPAAQLHPVRIADSTKVKVGEMVIAIGNPFGEQNTMTTGIVSALGRSLPVDNGVAQGPTYTIPDVIQTDAPINPGNSGGVLVDSQGQLIGVTSAIESPVNASNGIGFAIPSAIVQRVIPALIQSGHFDHPYLGVSGTTLTPSIAQAMGLQAGQRGALVGDVTSGGPASKAGLVGSTRQATIDGNTTTVGGDVIVGMDGQAVRSFDDVIAYLASSTQVNQTVTLTVLRDGKEQSIKVTLAARPQ